MRKYNLPIFIPHRGCPHDCIFCSQRKITGIETEVSPTEVRKLIKNFLSTLNCENSSVEVAFFGGSFTGLPLLLQDEFLKVAAEFYPQISGIRVSTRPDYINPEVLSLLKNYRVTTIELGVQSSDNAVLEANEREHNFETVIEASLMIKEQSFALGHQMMLGMYTSNPQKDLKTVQDIVALNPDCVRIYPVLTFKGTRLEEYLKNGLYVPYSTEEAAQLAKKAVLEFKAAGIEVIRIGLHSSEDFEGDEVLVAGPYHPAFGEIVESLIYRDKIEEQFLKNGIVNGKIEFLCDFSEVSKAVGHKKMNKLYFKEKYKAELCIVQRDRR